MARRKHSRHEEIVGTQASGNPVAASENTVVDPKSHFNRHGEGGRDAATPQLHLKGEFS